MIGKLFTEKRNDKWVSLGLYLCNYNHPRKTRNKMPHRIYSRKEIESLIRTGDQSISFLDTRPRHLQVNFDSITITSWWKTIDSHSCVATNAKHCWRSRRWMALTISKLISMHVIDRSPSSMMVVNEPYMTFTTTPICFVRLRLWLRRSRVSEFNAGPYYSEHQLVFAHVFVFLENILSN